MTQALNTKARHAVTRSARVLACLLFALMAWACSSQLAHAQGIQERADTLLTSIAETQRGTSSAWYVMELSACGWGTAADAPALVEETARAVATGTTVDATQLQRNVIALTAAGYDACALPYGGETYDAVAAMARRVSSLSPVNVKVATLLAYASGDYAVPAGALLSERALVNAILEAQHADGGFAYSGAATDADMTALALCALLPYAQEYPAAAEAATRAWSALLAMQLPDGSFPSGTSAEGNANSTAFAVIALCALGVDPAVTLGEGTDASPLEALLAFATPALDGFTYEGARNALATEQGFRALVAYQGLVNARGAYNIYTQAVGSSAVFTPVVLPSAPASAGEGAANEGAAEGTTTKGQKKARRTTKAKEHASKGAAGQQIAATSGSSGNTAASSGQNSVTAENTAEEEGEPAVATSAPSTLPTADAASAGVAVEQEASGVDSASAVIPWYLVAGLAVGCLGLVAAAVLFARARREHVSHA